MSSAAAFALVVVISLRAERQEPARGPLDSSRAIPVYIAPVGRGNRPGDRELAKWAMQAWSKATGGTLKFSPAGATPEAEKQALVRLYWVSTDDELYGEMRPIEVQGQRGAAVFVRSEIAGLGDEIDDRARKDSLFRDTVVYLTCLHEIGHALGLRHTANYADIMFSFEYEGDILNYFQRYRNKLKTQQDIAKHWGLSAQDITTLHQLYPAGKAAPPRK